MPNPNQARQIKVENLREVQKAIRDTGDQELKKQLRLANKNVAEMVVRAALPNVPVKTGRLRQSIRATATQKAAYGKAGRANTVPYAAAIHWGEGAGNVGGGVSRRNRNIPGRPFLWNAADQVINRAVEEYEDQIQDLLDRTVRGR